MTHNPEVYAAFTLFTERPRVISSEKTETSAIMNACLDNAFALRQIFEKHGTRFHFAPVGSWIEIGRNTVGDERLREIYSNFSIVNHTYAHNVLKPVAGRTPLSLDELEGDLRKAQSLIEKVWNKTPEVFISPCGYYKGFSEDAPENRRILNILRKIGFKVVVSDERGFNDSLYMPLIDDSGDRLRQPFIYSNGLFEFPQHGWQDVAFKGVHPSEKSSSAPFTDRAILRSYTKLYAQARTLASNLGRDIFLGLQFHSDFMQGPATPSGGWADKRLDICDRILRETLAQGVKVITIDDFYQMHK